MERLPKARSKLTICFIGSSISVHNAPRAMGFAKRGHSVYLICEKVTGIDGVKEIVPGMAYHLYGDVPGKSNPRIPVKSISAYILPTQTLSNFLQVLKDIKPDIIHVQYAARKNAWMSSITNFCPLVVSVWGGDILHEERNNYDVKQKWLTYQLLKAADVITAETKHNLSVLRGMNDDDISSKSIQVRWGVDLEMFRKVDANYLRKRFGISSNHKVIFSPRLLNPFYNIHLIVEAMPLIIKRHPDTRLIISECLADAKYKDNIIKLIQRLKLDNYVRLIGEVPPTKEMPAYYSLADVVVAVPPSDGLPRAMLEAMACGVPNILSSLERYEEFVTHETSAYFVEISSNRIAEGVIRLLSDRGLRDKIASNALKIVQEKLNLEDDLNQVEEIYYDLLSRPRKRRGLLSRARIAYELMK